MARGVAIGTVVCLHGRKRQFYRIDIAESAVEKEVRRFSAAVRLAGRQLRKISGRTRAENARTDIFETHLLILSDRSFVERIESIIREQRVNAEWAIKLVAEQYVAVHKEIGDEHLREKYIDIEDVSERLLTALGGGAKPVLKLPRNSIIVASEVRPSTLLELTECEPLAIVTEHGGWTSHTFILAREINLPAVTGMRGVLRRVQTGDRVVVDGFHGRVIVNPSTETLRKYVSFIHTADSSRTTEAPPVNGKLRTLDGIEIAVRANIDLPEGYVRAKRLGAVGIGLYRSEFLFNQFRGFPSEAEQIKAYRSIAALAGDDGVRIRTFDLNLGQIAEDRGEKEKNPALGLRAIRLMLNHRTEFRRQIRALLQASADHPLDIVLPMVSDIAEILETRKIIETERERLRRRNVRFGDPRLGAMIEVPAAVLIATEIAREVDFFCLGTNDLVQYLLAVDRDNEAVADWFRTLHPAVLRSIRAVINAARLNSIPAVVCGEMAGSPVYVPVLIGLGATELSMNVNSIPRVRRTIAGIAFEEARELTRRIEACRTPDEVEETIRSVYVEKWSHLFTPDSLPPARA